MADIELVIKLPKFVYDYIKQLGSIPTIDTQCVANAIFDGTPLPKGHGRLGDLDALIDELKEQQRNYEHTSCVRHLINEAVRDGITIARTHIDYAPTIIEADKGE